MGSGSCRSLGHGRRRRRPGELLERSAEYLRVRRGLKPGTVRSYCNHARTFLADRERRAATLALESLGVAAINDYLLRDSQRLRVDLTQAVALVLRSMLRFLRLEGLDRPLIARSRQDDPDRRRTAQAV